MEPCVFDASAVLAILLREDGSDHASQYLESGVISSVNLAEVVTKLVDLQIPSDKIEAVIMEVSLPMIDFDLTQASIAGSLRSTTRANGLSLGNRACLALALTTGRSALTADRAWANFDVGVRIEIIR